MVPFDIITNLSRCIQFIIPLLVRCISIAIWTFPKHTSSIPIIFYPPNISEFNRPYVKKSQNDGIAILDFRLHNALKADQK